MSARKNRYLIDIMVKKFRAQCIVAICHPGINVCQTNDLIRLIDMESRSQRITQQGKLLRDKDVKESVIAHCLVGFQRFSGSIFK
jgi:hypothetical protein